MNSEKIKVSVIIPAFNAQESIEATIISVIGQTYNNIEIITIDDGSVDDTATIINEYCKRDKRIVYVYQQNAGVSSARNSGIKIAKGDYVAFLDSDDCWSPDHLNHAVDFFMQYPEVKWHCSAYKIIKSCKEESVIVKSTKKVLNYFDYAHRIGIVWTGCVSIAREILVEKQGFNVKFTRGEDLDLWFRIALDYPLIGYNNNTTSHYNLQNSSSLTKKKQDLAIFIERVNSSLSYITNDDRKNLTRKLVNKWIYSVLKQIILNRRQDLLNNVENWKSFMNFKNIAILQLANLLMFISKGAMHISKNE